MGRLAPRAGDDCLSCADHWDSKVPPQPRRKLVPIGTSQNKKLQVVACPYCDGERAISMRKAQG